MMTDGPPAKVRSIDFLTPEQLKRKREVDRKSQRQARERTKAYITELEQKVHEFETRIQGLEQEFSAFVARCHCKNGSKSSSHNATREVTPWEGAAQTLPSPDEDEPVIGNTKDQWTDRGCRVDPTQWNSFANGLDLSIWQRIFDNTMLAQSQSFPLDSWFTESQTGSMPAIAFDSTPVWQYLPKHTQTPTCGVDGVVSDLLQIAEASRAENEGNIEGNPSVFPSIQSLLNPTYNAIKARVSRNIVENVLGVVTTPTLPERIGFLYIIYAIVRWQMNPTETTYYSLPEWMRPLPSQLFFAHPPWVDFFVWPKGRERLCLMEKYHNKHPDIVRICNGTMTCNWPYRPSDMLLQVGDSTILNPVFERHIRDLNNWTIAEDIFEEFPDLVDCVNLKSSSG